MKKFIISDLHGNGNIYDSIIGYLENVNKDYELTLYINGDLIDRGDYSAYMLLDVIKRIKNNEGFKIKYLAGNHELMMYQAYKRRYQGIFPRFCDWFINGGEKTLNPLEQLLSEEEIKKVVEFISKLEIYHKFKEKLDDKNIVLVHAKCPRKVEDICNIRIEDNDYRVTSALWTREQDLIPVVNDNLGNKDYFTIIGHTPLTTKTGYKYYSKYNCLNIDGGCAAYVLGYKQYDHVPLVEIDDNNKLDILTFSNDNEIISGNYFYDKKSYRMNDFILDEKRKYISNESKIMKLKKE